MPQRHALTELAPPSACLRTCDQRATVQVVQNLQNAVRRELGHVPATGAGRSGMGPGACSG